MLKHTRTVAAIAAASLLASAAAYANKGAEYKHHHEGHHKKFTLTGGATYLEPSFNGLDNYDIISTNAAGINSVSTENLEQSFNWGYFLGANYRISHHYDVQATWAQINTSNDDSDTITGATGGVTGIQTSNHEAISLAAGANVTPDTRETLDYQVFDATLGQYHDITDMLKTRLFAGIRYAKITTDVDNTYIQPGVSPALFDNYDSSFSGVGPEAGLDLEYKIYQHFGVVGSLAAAFLVGNQESSSTVYGTFNGHENSVDSDDNTRLIPAVNAKLGANWEIPYNLHDWNFGVEAGYQVAYYFNVADQVQYSSSTQDVTHNYSNVGFMGPYLNFSAAF
jgi:hypothetical protein